MMQENFLVTFVEKALAENGYTNLTEDMKKELVPQFVAQLEQRIGVSMLPNLSVENAEKFTDILKDKNASPKQLIDFWEKAVPNYQEIVKKEMETFLSDLKKIAK